jgi:hypothetical protein
MTNLTMPAKLHQTDGLKWRAPAFLAGFGTPIVLFSVAIALMVAAIIFGEVESPAIWQETGIFP